MYLSRVLAVDLTAGIWAGGGGKRREAVLDDQVPLSRSDPVTHYLRIIFRQLLIRAGEGWERCPLVTKGSAYGPLRTLMKIVNQVLAVDSGVRLELGGDTWYRRPFLPAVIWYLLALFLVKKRGEGSFEMVLLQKLYNPAPFTSSLMLLSETWP